MAKKKLEWDLVTRLREGRRNGSHHRHIIGELDREAEDEIERLREDNAAMRELLGLDEDDETE